MIEYVTVERCPVCGGKGVFDKHYDGDELGVKFDLYRCVNCHTNWQNPRLSDKSLAEYYRSGIYRSVEARHIKEEYALNSVVERLKMLDIFLRGIEMTPKRCLDVGCARGYMLKGLQRKYGAEIVGYDLYPDPEAIIDIVKSKDEIKGKYDLITCIHVLEHMPEPMKELTWMASLLNENGVLMIEIPFKKIPIVPHLTIFSRQSITLLMKHIHAKYIYWDIQYNDIGIMFTQPGLQKG